MTAEKKLNSGRYSEIAGLLYRKDPSVATIEKVVLKHVEEVHKFEEIVSLDKMLCEIEHIDAILTGRRNLDKLA